jgi:CDP-4-dehydro-6-deoxyglucose reductase
MTFQVKLAPSGHEFECEEGETLLNAALRHGIGLPYGCKSGSCASCKGRVLEGSVQHNPHQERALPPDELARRYALYCCAVPTSDLTIEAREVDGLTDYPVKKLPTRVAKIERLSADVIALHLQLPAVETFRYRAGQYIEFLLKDGKRRSYSMASAPQQEPTVSLHIRHLPGGLFTDRVFKEMKEREILRFEGPLGSFFLREDSDKPMVLLASGTGFAPIKAMVEDIIAKGIQRPMRLYWGGRRPQDLYMDALARQWAQELPDFTYVPVLSDALPADGWSGRSGLVHQAVMADLPDLSGWQVYACGAPRMVDAARQDFSALCHLPGDEFYADAFITEADLSPAV